MLGPTMLGVVGNNLNSNVSGPIRLHFLVDRIA